MLTGATFSPCRTYRYHLHRTWATGARLVFVMLNPSTADATENDPTIRRCIRFGRALGYQGIEVVNLYAYRATKPADLRAAGYPVGPENDQWIRETAERAVETGGAVVCAWGANAAGLARPMEVLRLLRAAGVRPMCLRLTRTGQPQHPLMLPSDCRLQPFEG